MALLLAWFCNSVDVDIVFCPPVRHRLKKAVEAGLREFQNNNLARPFAGTGYDSGLVLQIDVEKPEYLLEGKG